MNEEDYRQASVADLLIEILNLQVAGKISQQQSKACTYLVGILAQVEKKNPKGSNKPKDTKYAQTTCISFEDQAARLSGPHRSYIQEMLRRVSDLTENRIGQLRDAL